MTTLVLFDVPATGHKASKSKPKEIMINRINRKIAKRRYYLHRQLSAEFELVAADREIKAPYKSFTDIPVGQRWYIGELIKLGYKIQYELF